ncbi:hypothetical protein [Geomicrobium sp. JCM 19039]|uniref:hypothetical protein n=1 Tax=Geomicrobium sp. JCM 19039 TaxID=1460636 RepID=UPI00045F1B08|nr:hypothetical protein [Geomicrobium sp. JCM 19039]GAK12218.1 Tiorf63 protein [Geomicrobium sp. JCM 19039]
MKDVHVLSLGAGVQSTAMLYMSLRGDLPKPDYIVFADTGWEPQDVYDHVEFLKRECERYGQELVIVNNGNIKDDMLESARTGKRMASLPYFTYNPDKHEGDGYAAVHTRVQN